MSFNFADAYNEVKDAISGNVLPNGEYEVRVKSVKTKVTQGGKQAFVVVLEVMSGPLAGKSIPEQLTWSPESDVAVRMFSGAMNMMGASKDWIMAAQPTPEQIAERITGATVKISTTQDEWNGEPRNRVRFLSALDSPAAAAAGGGTGGPTKPPTLGQAEDEEPEPEPETVSANPWS